MSGSMPSVMCALDWLCCPFYWVPDISMRSPNWLFLILLLMLGGLQHRLWVGNGSLAQVASLTQQIADQHAENEVLLERNRVLDAEVLELKKGLETVEERARHELGMVKDGETLYQLAQ
ncbi:Cell division protein FtsB [Pseudomonas cannabina]|uniref:Cell division protein FtsB n=2 Tax=Pseudomonas cannabina TaxID=86840 RepID=A0A0P9NAF6_PSECA|nr:Cell division protein FtsB [Pseudomonas cannabina]